MKENENAIYHQQEVPSGFDRGYEYRTDFAFYDTSCGLRIDIEVDGAFKEHDDDIQKNVQME